MTGPALSPERRAPLLYVLAALFALRVAENVAVAFYSGFASWATFVRLPLAIVVAVALYVAVRRGSEAGRWLTCILAMLAAAFSTIAMYQLMNVRFGVAIYSFELFTCVAIAWVVSDRSLRALTPPKPDDDGEPFDPLR